MRAFSTQIRASRTREDVLGAALATLTEPLGRAGFKLAEQDPDHVVWTRKPPGLRALLGASDRITMSFAGSPAGDTIVTIAGNAPPRIVRDFERLAL